MLGDKESSVEEPWSDLISAWRARGHFGLTVPFLLGGVLQHPNNPIDNAAEVKEKFQKLLELISEYGINERYARLAYCDRADDLIVAPVTGNPELCKRVIDAEGKLSQLWIQHDIEAATAPTITSLVQTLWGKYGNAVSQGYYSRRGGEYLPFDNADYQLLAEANEQSA
jgi:hypothetical protein